MQRVEVTWAKRRWTQAQWVRLCVMHRRKLVDHWSRVFEYPWALEAAELKPGMLVLDAAGGDGALQYELVAAGCRVVNVDVDPSRQPADAPGVEMLTGDLRDLRRLAPDATFDRVCCVSVLEHVERPWEALSELWRVLKPGGRLLLTFDVAEYARRNHTIDIQVAGRLLSQVGWAHEIPPLWDADETMTFRFAEEPPLGTGDRSHVNLRCLCVRADKE